MKRLTIAATLENLEVAQAFVERELEEIGCPPRVVFQVSIAVEEIYVNIARYAYNPDIGEATIQFSVGGDPLQIVIQFLDSGRPFDPLAKKDADTTLSAEDREIGGLGILMVKKSMDTVEYIYEDGKNILTIRKSLPE